MKKLKTQKGITLVALIITIVVLLILAVVAIGAVKNSDIIGYAQDAVTSYSDSENNELDIMIEYENQIKNAESSETKYDNSYQKYFQIVEDEEVLIENGKKFYFLEVKDDENIPSKIVIPKQFADGYVLAVDMKNPKVNHICIPEVETNSYFDCMQVYHSMATGDLRISSETGIVDIDCESESEYKPLKALKSITFDDNIIKMSAYFYDCKGLEKVKFPKNLKEIFIPEGNTIFDHCNSLKSVEIPKSLEILNRGSVFASDCYALEEITYTGTKQEWDLLLSNNGLTTIFGGRKVTVHCTDGDVVVE